MRLLRLETFQQKLVLTIVTVNSLQLYINIIFLPIKNKYPDKTGEISFTLNLIGSNVLGCICLVSQYPKMVSHPNTTVK